MMIPEIGQKLWWVDERAHTEGTVEVYKLGQSKFQVLYNGHICEGSYTAIGKTLFYKSQLKKRERKCEHCLLRANGSCTSLCSKVCEDFRMKQDLPVTETHCWPRLDDFYDKPMIGHA